jgi:hypothetical protein
MLQAGDRHRSPGSAQDALTGWQCMATEFVAPTSSVVRSGQQCLIRDATELMLGSILSERTVIVLGPDRIGGRSSANDLTWICPDATIVRQPCSVAYSGEEPR